LPATLYVIGYRDGNPAAEPPAPDFPKFPGSDRPSPDIDSAGAAAWDADQAAAEKFAADLKADPGIVDAAMEKWRADYAQWEATAVPDHIYKVAVWVERPLALIGRGQVTIHVPSRETSPSRGMYRSVIPGAPCAGCNNGVEPASLVPSATDADKAKIADGTVLEFVIDEAGGQVPDAVDDNEKRRLLAAFAAEVEEAVAEAARIVEQATAPAMAAPISAA